MTEAALARPAPARMVLGVENLTVAYDRHPAVHHVSGGFADGSLTAIVGPNGAGKSSFLKALMGLLPAAEGRVVRDGLAATDLAYLPQQAEIDRGFPINVGDLVRLGHWRRVGAFRRVGRALRDEAEAALARVGLDGFARRPIGTLSVGQFQRALFARLLLQDARVVLLDEPFAGVDERTTEHLLTVIHDWHRSGRTVVAVLHDLDQVRAHFPETLLLARRAVAWGPTVDVLRPGVLGEARTMAESWASDAAPCHVH